jgi:hypothetical protein
MVAKVESMGLQQDISEEEVKKVLDNIGRKHIEDFSGALADEIYDGPRASTTGGQMVVADGGSGFFEGRSGRTYFVSFSVINSAMVGVHLQSGREIGVLINSAILIACFSMYLASEYNVTLEVQ